MMTAAQVKIADLYRQVRLATTYREKFGRLPKIDHLPAWVRENLDELGLAALRVELIEAFRSGPPRQAWDEQEPPPGDWVDLGKHPEALVEMIDRTVREELDAMAVGIVRDLMNNRSTTAASGGTTTENE